MLRSLLFVFQVGVVGVGEGDHQKPELKNIILTEKGRKLKVPCNLLSQH